MSLNLKKNFENWLDKLANETIETLSTKLATTPDGTVNECHKEILQREGIRRAKLSEIAYVEEPITWIATSAALGFAAGVAQKLLAKREPGSDKKVVFAAIAGVALGCVITAAIEAVRIVPRYKKSIEAGMISVNSVIEWDKQKEQAQVLAREASPDERGKT